MSGFQISSLLTRKLIKEFSVFSLLASIFSFLSGLPYLTVYKTHKCIKRTPISAGQIKKKKKRKENESTNIKHNEINVFYQW